jgi:hypothetical protein
MHLTRNVVSRTHTTHTHISLTTQHCRRSHQTMASAMVLLWLAVQAPIGAGYFWQPLQCYPAAWTARGSVCEGTFSAQTCARSQADMGEYVQTLETTLLGPPLLHCVIASHPTNPCPPHPSPLACIPAPAPRTHAPSLPRSPHPPPDCAPV